MPYLKDHFQLIAWDLPAHGGSAASAKAFSMIELSAGVVTMIQSLEADGTISPEASLYYAGVSVGGATAL